MSTTTYAHDTITSPADGSTLEYRAVHTGAVIGLSLGIVSVFVVFSALNSLEAALLVSPIPVAGMFVSLRAWGTIARERERYTGMRLAQAGLLLSLVFLAAGLGYGGYVYATEVPEGYVRISFADLQPDEIQRRSGTIVPQQIRKLDGRKVYIKGYIRPGSISVRKNIDRFLLVRDNQQCCFGDLSRVNYFDQVQVQLLGALRIDYTDNVVRMGGTLSIRPENLALGPGYPIFSLRADYAK